MLKKLSSGSETKQKKPEKMTIKDIDKMKLESKLKEKGMEAMNQEQSAMTGQNALRLSQAFHRRLVFLKQHLDTEIHPIAQIIANFKTFYSCQYQYLLMKNKRILLRPMLPTKEKGIPRDPKKVVENNVRVLKNELKQFIEQIVVALLSFYSIKLGPTDIKRELVVNMVTNIILKDEIYIIVYRMLSEQHWDDILKLRSIQANTPFVDSKFSLDAL
jgi:hypothetical protein